MRRINGQLRAMGCTACIVGLLLTAGCSQVRGSTSATNAARVFLEAVASGDTARANAVSVKTVSASDLTYLRRALFGTPDQFDLSAVSVQPGWETVQGNDPTTYLGVDSFAKAGATLQTSDDAFANHQIGVQKRGDAWVVVTWGGPGGRWQ